MTNPSAESNVEASDTDLAEQALAVEDTDDEPDPFFAGSAGEADPADVLEQHQSVPAGDDDYR